MPLRATAFAVLLASSRLVAAADTNLLTLDDAFARVIEAHPDLRLFAARAAGLSAERDRAAQRPQLTAGVAFENAPGSGAYAGIDSAETTLSLASVLEPRDRRDARVALAQRRIDALDVEREATRLDLLAEVARRYLDVVAGQQNGEIATLDIAQRRRTVDAASKRLRAGASPESVVLVARVALAQAELAAARAAQQATAARYRLAALWGGDDVAFEAEPRRDTTLPNLEPVAELARLLDDTPELARFAGEQRIREARLQLARTQSSRELEWQVGLRRFEAEDDMALIGSLTIPLGSRTRAQPEIRAADAELTALGIERESKQRALHATLVEAHGRYGVAQVEAARLRSDVLPLLSEADAAAERAYTAGAASYLEWAQLQSERTAARHQLLDAELDAQRALIEIQRLTGHSFLPSSTAELIP